MFEELIDLRVKNLEENVKGLTRKMDSMAEISQTIGIMNNSLDGLKTTFITYMEEQKQTQEKMENKIEALEREPLNAYKGYKTALITMLITTPTGLIIGAVMSMIMK